MICLVSYIYRPYLGDSKTILGTYFFALLYWTIIQNICFSGAFLKGKTKRKYEELTSYINCHEFIDNLFSKVVHLVLSHLILCHTCKQLLVHAFNFDSYCLP